MSHTLNIIFDFDDTLVYTNELFDIAKERFPDTAYYMIGDNPTADILGGNNAAMTTVSVHIPPHATADHSFQELRDILSVLPK